MSSAERRPFCLGLNVLRNNLLWNWNQNATLPIHEIRLKLPSISMTIFFSLVILSVRQWFVQKGHDMQSIHGLQNRVSKTNSELILSFYSSYQTLSKNSKSMLLTHWGRVTHICVSKITIIGSDNGLLPDRRQAIIWTIAGILLIGLSGINFSEILIEIPTFSFKKVNLKVSSAKPRPFCLGLNELRIQCIRMCHNQIEVSWVI